LPSEHASELEEIRAGLVAVTERLDELALAVLHEAVEAGATTRPELERRLTRARHALERALALVRAPEQLEDDVP
jgi:hypothetical protein